MSSSNQSVPGAVPVDSLYLAQDGEVRSETTWVVREDALQLRVEGVGDYTLMWTPTTTETPAQAYTLEDGVLGDEERPEGLALALGFAVSEGLIQSLSDLRALSICEETPQVVNMQLRAPERVRVTRRDVVINSSCGICGPREILEDNALGLAALPHRLLIRRDDIAGLMSAMRERQEIFDETGGSHAAAIFNARGEIVAVAEDLGRHNALDKAIGMALMRTGTTAGCGVVLSSRLSLEMVVKAVRSGLEIVLAVSAPTSLAINVAERFGVTLCGFVRGDRATIYSHPARVSGTSSH